MTYSQHIDKDFCIIIVSKINAQVRQRASTFFYKEEMTHILLHQESANDSPEDATNLTENSRPLEKMQ